MGKVDPGNGRKSGLGLDLAVSLGVAVWLAGADALALRAATGATLDELLFRPHIPPGLSEAGSILLVLLGAGLVVGLGVGLLQRRVIRSEGPVRLLLSMLFALGSLAFVLILLRAQTLDETVYLVRYLGRLGTAAVLLLALVLLVQALGRRGTGAAAGRAGRAAWALSVLLGLVLLTGPGIQNVALPRKPRPEKQARRPNVLILMLDTLRADALSCLNPATQPTPQIDRMAREGILFRKAISPSPWTVPSHGSLFTGLFPTQHGALWEHPVLDRELRSLAELMYRAGYRTVGFSENPHVSNFAFGHGFEEFSELITASRRAVLPSLLGEGLGRLLGRPRTFEYTRESVSHLIRWLRGNALGEDGPPFFAFLNLMAAHLPAYARPGFNPSRPSPDVVRRLAPINLMPQRFNLPAFRLRPGDLETLHMFYRGDVAYLDSRLGLLFDFLRGKHLLDDTVLVIVADHGENFGEHGLIEHAFCLYNTLLSVPLIIRFPARISAGTVRDDLVSMIHFFDTILDLTGLPSRPGPASAGPRRSLLDGVPDEAVFAECDNLVYLLKNALPGQKSAEGFDYSPFDKSLECVYHQGFKLIRSSDGGLELYDTSADWAEDDNLAGARPEVVKKLAEMLTAWRRGLAKPRPEGDRIQIPRGAREALKSLGYVH
jgi:arylsulfatase A-like enzyme